MTGCRATRRLSRAAEGERDVTGSGRVWGTPQRSGQPQRGAGGTGAGCLPQRSCALSPPQQLPGLLELLLLGQQPGPQQVSELAEPAAQESNTHPTPLPLPQANCWSLTSDSCSQSGQGTPLAVSPYPAPSPPHPSRTHSSDVWGVRCRSPSQRLPSAHRCL